MRNQLTDKADVLTTSQAAKLLGISVRTLRNKIRGYSADGIDVPTPNE